MMGVDVETAGSEPALSAAEPAATVAVKDLEWKQNSEDWEIWSAPTILGPYDIMKILDKWEVTRNTVGKIGALETLEEAKAAAQADYDARIRSALSAQVQDVAKGWHVASNSGSVLVYCLKQDGWRKGEPVMVNDIMIRVENANRSSNELQPIVDAIMRALPAAPAKQEG